MKNKTFVESIVVPFFLVCHSLPLLFFAAMFARPLRTERQQLGYRRRSCYRLQAIKSKGMRH